MKKESSRNNISDLEIEIKIGDLCCHLNNVDNDILLVIESIPSKYSCKIGTEKELYKQGYYRCLSSKKRIYTILGIHLRKICNV